MNEQIPEGGVRLYAIIEELENQWVDRALEQARGNRSEAARLLGLNRTTLVEKMRKRGMIVPKAKPSE